MIENDEFLPLVPSECIKANALEKIHTAMNKQICVLFMKGSPDFPADGYQEKAILMLESIKLNYSCFDVLKESEVRELLKEHSRWSSFP